MSDALAEIVIMARLHPGLGWYLTRIDLDARGAKLDEGEATQGYFPSSAVAREWYHRMRRSLSASNGGVPVFWAKGQHRDV